MLHTTEYSEDGTKLTVRCFGILTGKEIIEINEPVVKNRDLVIQLWDMLAMTKMIVSMEEMHTISLQDRSFPLNSKFKKIAFVMTQQASDGCIEMYDRFSRIWVGRPVQFEHREFRSLEEADKWLYEEEK